MEKLNKYFRYACIALPLLFLILFSTAFSQNKEPPVNFNFYGSFAHTERLPNALFFFSEIRDKDSFYFRKALRNHKIKFIVLASPGGSVFEALQIAAIINDKGLATFVPEVNSEKPEICASACAFMLLAGKERKVDGRLGVHQFLSTSDKQRNQSSAIQQTTQFTVSEIIGFFFLKSSF